MQGKGHDEMPSVALTPSNLLMWPGCKDGTSKSKRPPYVESLAWEIPLQRKSVGILMARNPATPLDPVIGVEDALFGRGLRCHSTEQTFPLAL